jgi:cytochrome c biogenesis protein CcmG/thiol:disulfide interchange protein DsbE
MKRSLFFLLPLFVFLLIAGFLLKGLWLDPKEVPSPLINKPAPAFQLTDVADETHRLGKQDLLGQVYLLNVWASWCVSCREEHPLLVELSRQKQVPLIGLDYKDTRPQAMQTLAQLGNPYQISLFDPDGKVGIDYGVYGVPETYVIDKQGIIRYKQIGPITPDVWQQTLLPLIRRLQA